MTDVFIYSLKFENWVPVFSANDALIFDACAERDDAKSFAAFAKVVALADVFAARSDAFAEASAAIPDAFAEVLAANSDAFAEASAAAFDAFIAHMEPRMMSIGESRPAVLAGK